MATTKRARSPTPPAPSEPTLKAQRTPSPAPAATNQAATASLIRVCTLPPTCDPPRHAPTRLAMKDPRAYERHHAMYHANVCEECNAVFPEPMFLELVRLSSVLLSLSHLTQRSLYLQHQTECHDPISAMKKERGEKIVRAICTHATSASDIPLGSLLASYPPAIDSLDRRKLVACISFRLTATQNSTF
jgi:hypothetical protein